MQKSIGFKGLLFCGAYLAKTKSRGLRGKLQYLQGVQRNKADGGGCGSCMRPALNRTKCYLTHDFAQLFNVVTHIDISDIQDFCFKFLSQLSGLFDLGS